MISNVVKYCEQVKQAELGFIPDYPLGPADLIAHLITPQMAIPGIKKQHLTNLRAGRALLTENDAYYLSQAFKNTTIKNWLDLERHYRK